ncbi:MAG: translation initiation factor IF-2 [Christensenellales bacterium]
MANNNQELNSLKSIHKIQTSGEIQNLLRQLKTGKSEIDSLIKAVSQHKNVLVVKTESANAVKPAASQTENVSAAPKQVVQSKNAVKPEVKAESVKQVETNPSVASKQEHSQVKQTFQGNPNNTKRSFENNRDGNYQNRPFQQNNTNNRAFNNDQRRPFNNDGRFQNNDGRAPRQFNNDNRGQRPFNNDNRAPRQFNNDNRTPRPFNDNRVPRPFGTDNRAGRPFNNDNRSRNAGTSFASSRTNAVKVFTPLESSKVLAQPERTFGNKNKTKRNYDEKEKQTAKKGVVSSKRANVLISDDDYEEIIMGSRKLIKNKKKEPVYVAPAIEHAVITTETVTVKVLSEKIGKPVADIIKKLMILGVMATINSAIDFTTAELISSELGVTLEQKLELTAEQELSQFVSQDKHDDSEYISRPPVVAVMGHVDHGKTSLLDIIRKESVALGEAGGITQSIGAYQVSSNGQKITFLDTPGHAAFTAMRARGAKITDIAILVVAADDGIMPQTIEAINHIKAAGIPMIVAVNKMDKKEANPDRIKQQLAEHGLLPEEWGGDTILVGVSAKTGMGIDELLKMILLVAEMQDLKANPKVLALGAVIEASLDKAKGPIATVLVQNGTLKIGDTIISGITYGKVKAMYDEKGNSVKEAAPSTPVSVLGLNEVPQSGDQVYALDEKLSKQVIEERKNKLKSDQAAQSSAVSLDSFMDKVNEGKLKNLNVIIKADSQGSVEALKYSLIAVSNDEVKIVCVHSGSGPVTESDLVLAQASNSVVINFNLKVNNRIKTMAESMGVNIKSYKVIYEVVEEIASSALGMREKVYEKVVTGHAEVRVVFKLSSAGVIAGSYVTDGKIYRNAGARVLRNGEEIAETTIEALKIQKDDKAEVNYGYECGIKLKDFNQFKEGDIIEVYQKVEVKR